MSRGADFHRPFVDLLDRTAVRVRDDPAAYGRIRARLDEVRQWYAERAGWAVVCNRELARLVKTPAAPRSGHGLDWVQGIRDYELFTWVLWYAEGVGGEQFLLTQLVAEIEARAGELLAPGHVDWDDYGQRLSLQRVLRGLEEMGALVCVHGDTDQWAHDRSGDTLYEFTALTRQLYLEPPWDAQGPPQGPSPGERGPAVPGVGPEQRLYRTLLLSPALYAVDDPEAFALLQGRDRRARIAADLRDTLGWDLELTVSYACLLRPSASEASVHRLFPVRGARGDIVLLLCARLRELVAQGELAADPYDRVRLTRARLLAILAELREAHGVAWGRTVGRLGTQALGEEVVGLLEEWDLLSEPDADGQVYVLPLAARFAGAYAAEDRPD